MHQVRGNKIIEISTGQEMLWRGAGGAYNFHGATPQDTINAWQNVYIPLAKKMSLNTMRLAFSLPYNPDDLANPYSTYAYNESLMDSVVNLLASNGMKSILDCHMYEMFYPHNTGSTLSPLLIQEWQNIAAHYNGNENIAAYELFNEPVLAYGNTYRHTAQENAQGYHDLTLAIRSVDKDHICIWQSPVTYGTTTTPHYIPTLDQISTLLLPNIVYTYHVWHMLSTIVSMGGADAASTIDLNTLLNFRNTNYTPVGKVPIWVGEFGYEYNESFPPNVDATWDYCKMFKVKCENNDIGYNLWMGATNPTYPIRLQQYVVMFPKPPAGNRIPLILATGIGIPLIIGGLTAALLSAELF